MKSLSDKSKNHADIDTLISSIIINEKEVEEIKAQNLSDTIGETLLEAFGPIGTAISKIIELGDKNEENFRERKKEYLLVSYIKQTDDISGELEKIKSFVVDPYGSMLYSKIIFILNENIPKREYIDLLAKVLKKITESDFKSHFEEHKYALDLIGRLSPQALLLLSDCIKWPEYTIRNYSSDKGVITSEWIDVFSDEYASILKITDPAMIVRISHVLRELYRLDLIQSFIPGATDSKDAGSIKDSDNTVRCVPTVLGKELLAYIEP